MSYSSLSNLDLKQQFGVEQAFTAQLFAKAMPRKLREMTWELIKENLFLALAQGTEKARSEYIIAPVFAELRRQAKQSISIFSGWEFNIDEERGLTGFCDFLVSRSAY